MNFCTNHAFTLAEVLITLGIIGVVAALTLPTLLQNINGKIRAEQIRTVKYKFTKATDKMNSDENSDYSSPNVGIVTADGTPMILSYNKKC